MYTINFICPHCHEETGVVAIEYCPVANEVLSFEVVGYEGNAKGSWEADEVEVDYGPRDVHEPDSYNSHWYCSKCLDEIDPEIESDADLFNWLRERGMLEGEDPDW
jgi:hypothetical protein